MDFKEGTLTIRLKRVYLGPSRRTLLDVSLAFSFQAMNAWDGWKFDARRRRPPLSQARVRLP